MLNCFLVQLTIVNTQPNFPRALFDKHSRGHPRTTTFLDDSLIQHAVYLLFNLFSLVGQIGLDGTRTGGPVVEI